MMQLVWPSNMAVKDAVYGVFDGHGEYGEEVSRRFADKFLDAVTKHPFWATNIERACREELARLEGEILADSSIDCAFSGTTVAFAAVRRNRVFWCNVGDSRITLVCFETAPFEPSR